MKKEEKDYYAQTYGKFKFKVSLPHELESAMGLTGESTQFKKMIMNNYSKFYEIIDAPKEGDWLMTHKEYGQTYEEYIHSGCIQTTPNRNVIYLTPLSFSEDTILEDNFLASIHLLCEAYFPGMKIHTHQIERNIECGNTKDSEQGKLQLNAEQFVDCLAKEVPSDAFCLIGITDVELYKEIETKDGKILYKIKNFAKDVRKRVNIISTCKYPSIRSKLSKMQQTKLIFKRICKVILKEICSMFGMKNCIYFACNMNGTNSMSELDNKPFELCPICLRKLITNISAKGHNIKQYRMKNSYIIYDRFVKLRDVLQEIFYGFFENEIIWLNARIDALKNDL